MTGAWPVSNVTWGRGNAQRKRWCDVAEEEWMVSGGVTSPRQLCYAAVSVDGDIN